ncbi:MAG: hypothetical protein Sylvanvirus4_13 [Sylvanvirus sp.]|uniref:Uncharacterized protein n=1 Tax=Sylvanvirus sp. TaxID=2487774 RepID=A0A3G5AKX2_9VIRU|nr:MAG: hypothetical protein Sylvanvirus4_13 [Sylvanvirus sp.]
MRLFILRVFSVNVFYFVRSLILTSENTCSVSLLGIQHTLIIISYVLGDLIADFLWPAVYRCWKKRTTRYTREYQACLELNLAEEYSATAFRHYLLCSGASFMPGLAVLALMGNLIKLKCDQYRISHLCRLRHRVYATYHKFLLVLGFVTVLAFLIGYPKGILMMFINRNTFFTCDLLAY